MAELLATRIRRADEAVAAAQRLRDLLDESRRTPLRERPVVTEARAERVRTLCSVYSEAAAGAVAGIGSVLLIPELLTKPARESAFEQLHELVALLARLDLRPTDEATAESA